MFEGDGAEDPLGAAVGALLRLGRLFERADVELTLPQYRLLTFVRAEGESSARIAEKLSVRRPTLTAAADGLVDAGYLAREPDPRDRRVVRLCSTPSGRAALARTDAALRARLAPVIAQTSDPDRLLALLGEVGQVLDARRAAHPARPAETRA